jgi:hypothetical protein
MVAFAIETGVPVLPSEKFLLNAKIFCRNFCFAGASLLLVLDFLFNEYI